MPSAIMYIPPTDPQRNDFNGEVASERLKRRQRYRLALSYYLGQHPEQLPVDLDLPETERVDDNTIINLVQMTADRTTSFLFPKMPKFETDPASVEDTPEEVWIKAVFEANGGLQSLALLALRGFLSGHAFMRVKPAPKSKRGRKNVYPKMLVLDPTSVTVYWRADDVADVVWYEMRYMVGGVPHIQDFVKDDENDVWKILTYQQKGGHSEDNMPGQPTLHGSSNTVAGVDFLEFSASGGTAYELIETAIHASTIPPIIEFPHLPHPDDYYGMGEFTQQTLQDTINKIASLQNQLVRENASPVDVVTGADVDDVEPGNGIVTIGSAAARVTRLELRGDLAGIKGTLDKLIETYLAVARVVLLKGEAKDLQRVTNASVRTLFLDALSKNELLQSAYGYGLKRLVTLFLQMGFEAGQVASVPDNINVTVHFPTPLPVDDTEIANQNAIMLTAGARSKRTAAMKMGDDWKFELAAMLAEQEQANEKLLQQGEIAAQNAKKLAEAVPPAPAAPNNAPGAGKPFGK